MRFFFFVLFFSAQANWAEQTFTTLSVREKIGQLFFAAAASGVTHQEEILSSALRFSSYNLAPEYIETLITKYHIGGLIFLYKSTPEKQIDRTNYCQSISSIPLLIAQDCEWGLSMRLDDTIQFPHAMTLGALADSSLIYEVGKEIGRQCKAIGVHLVCGPVVDVNNNPLNPVINNRSFGDSPEKVAQCSTLFIKGLQESGVLACAKHFPGHGDTSVDSHCDLPVIKHSQEHLEKIELYPFKKVIASGIDAIMTGHLLVPAFDDEIATLSYPIITTLLQKQLKFNGLVVTDGMGMRAIGKKYSGAQAALKAFLAGNTIILCPLQVEDAIDAIEKAVLTNPDHMKLLDIQVLKILKTKEQLHLHTNRFIEKEKALNSLHTDKALGLKKETFSQAVTLVKNNGIVPLQKKDNVALVCCGKSNTTIIQNAFNCPYYNETIPEEAIAHYDTFIITLFGMNKYKQKNFGIAQETINLLKKLSTKKIILVIFGSPYSLSLCSTQDAIIIAYQDVPETQQAVTEIIQGTRQAKGILPVLTAHTC